MRSKNAGHPYGLRAPLHIASNNNIDQNTVALAVVVQEMVNAEAAGILFTANPINGHRDEMVINAAWGLGEAIVGGLVSPDTIVADKATGKVKKYDVAEKTVITVMTEKGTREDPLNDARRKSQVMKEAQVVEFVNIARRIETFYGKSAGHRMVSRKWKFLHRAIASHHCIATRTRPMEFATAQVDDGARQSCRTFAECGFTVVWHTGSAFSQQSHSRTGRLHGRHRLAGGGISIPRHQRLRIFWLPHEREVHVGDDKSYIYQSGTHVRAEQRTLA